MVNAVGSGGADYRVVRGDTLWEIAQRNNISLKSLISANPQIKNPNLIFPGQQINIPGASRSGSLNGIRVAPSSTPAERPGRSTRPRSSGAESIPGGGNGSLSRALEIARGELGVREIAGARDNGRILQYHATTGGFTSDEVPWCASFVNWTLKQAGIRGTGSAAAKSFLNWGTRTTTPKPGDIVVFNDLAGNNPSRGHVGFFLGFEGNSVRVLGGNQSDSVKVSLFPRSEIAGFRTRG